MFHYEYPDYHRDCHPKGPVRPDWEQTNPDHPAYIANKPNVVLGLGTARPNKDGIIDEFDFFGGIPNDEIAEIVELVFKRDFNDMSHDKE